MKTSTARMPSQFGADIAEILSIRPPLAAPVMNVKSRDADDRVVEETRSFRILKAWCEDEKRRESGTG